MNLNLEKMIQPVPYSNKFYEDDYYIWDGSMVKHENKYYLIYSRWPKDFGHYAWISHSEVACAVADSPFGPFEFVKVLLSKRGTEFWDGTTTHNPMIIKVKDKYYLYHMGTYGYSNLKNPISMSDPNWWEYRNNQRIGVAVSTHPLGPWERFDKPILDVSVEEKAFDSLMTSNPAVCEMSDGRILMVYKAVTKGETDGKAYRGGVVKHGVAIAETPDGVFVKQPGTIFEASNKNLYHMVAEDPFIWCDKNMIYAITRDVMGLFTGVEAGLALFESKDGLDWSPAKHPKVLGRFKWEDGTKYPSRVERPFLFFEDGIPRVLLGSADNNTPNRADAFNVQIPLKNIIK